MNNSNDLEFFNRIPVAGLLVNTLGRPNFICNNKFLSLVGYTEDEINDIFASDYRKVFNEDDVLALREQLRDSWGTYTSVKQEFKLNTKTGEVIITMAEAETSEENDGSYAMCALTDITEIREAQGRLLQERERIFAVIKASRDNVFEYDIQNDILKVFDKTNIEIGFGQTRWSRVPGFLRMVEMELVVHPDDTRELKRALITDEECVAHVRLRTFRANSFRWTEINSSPIHNQFGETVGVVGTLHDINELKTSNLVFKNKSQHDSLTGLYNNAAVREIIENYLSKGGSELVNVLLLMDLDDFKNVNDSFGHRFGDNVIKTAADILTETFGENDIIARVGGDEYVVFCKEVLDMKQIDEKINSLYRRFESTPIGTKEQYIIKASIGISVSPTDGTTYKKLFDKADKMMYKVKRTSKNTYKFH